MATQGRCPQLPTLGSPPVTPGKLWADEELAVDAIGLHRDLQVRVKGLSKPHLRKLVGALEDPEVALEPVKVARIGKALWLVDGHHRLEAHKSTGRATIAAKVARMSRGEAKAAARAANAAHGKPLSRDDKAQVWADYTAEGSHLDPEGNPKASRVIEAELGRMWSHETVRQKLRALGLTLQEDLEFPGGHKPFRGGGEDTEEALEEALVEDLESDLRDFGSRFGQLPSYHRERLLKVVQGMLEAIERGEEPGMQTLLDQAAPF